MGQYKKLTNPHYIFVEINIHRCESYGIEHYAASEDSGKSDITIRLIPEYSTYIGNSLKKYSLYESGKD